MYKSFFAFFILISFVSCSNEKTQLTELPFEKDLFPEGIAIDSRTKKVYLNSLKKSKIVNSSINGNNPETFLKTEEYNYLAGFGMTIKGDTLYALGNSLIEKKNKSILLLLQLSSGELIDSYSINDSGFQYLNDLTISRDNEIFITDSESNKIYKIQRPNKNLEVYLTSNEIPNSNGITISDDNKYLYLASGNGICIVEKESKKIINTPQEVYVGIDGLKFYKNNLYGIVNAWQDQSKNGLFKFELNKTGTEILSSKKIVEFKENFKIPTTFDILQGNIYFVINTQLNNFDEKTNKTINPNVLETYKLIKIKLTKNEN